MGSRVMEARNPGGKTVRRHLVPKRVRRSRKRAVRAAARPKKIAKRVRAPKRATPRKAVKKTRALVKVAAPVKFAAPARSAVSTGLAKVTGPAKTTGTAKSTGIAKAKRGMRKAPKTPTPELAAAPEKPQPQPLDYLQDGAVEWGIKRD